MKTPTFAILTCLLFLLCSNFAFAHKASDSYLRFMIDDNSIQGQWDIALRDLDYAVGIDENTDGQITWGELRHKHQAITNYAFSRLQITRDGSTCWKHMTEHLVDSHTDGSYAVLLFSVTCPQTMHAIDIQYGLLFDLDPLHRGLLQVKDNEHVKTGILSPEKPSMQLDLMTHSPWGEFLQFSREGVWHIWIGYDHILFLISLLLPAVLWWGGRQWHAVDSFPQAFWKVAKIVTAFTLAHSLTLSLAVLGVVNVPSRWVESAIAASVLFAALHNLHPIIRTRLWMFTFLFGLIHGLGFASVLTDLGLPGTSLGFALAGFNVGVEIGQIVIVSLFIPLAFMIRRSVSYQRVVLNMGSLTIAFIAFIWFMERSLNVNLGMGIW